VFATCAVPIHSWSTLMFFNQMPGWLVYLNAWDLVGTFAYTQVFALLESVMGLLIVLLLGAILPGRVLRNKFAAQGSTLVSITLVFSIMAQYTQKFPFTRKTPWNSGTFLLGAALYLASLGVSFALIHRYEWLEKFIKSFVERLTILLYVYIFTSFTSIIIVILRNV
jgi:hypothetical protein